MADEPWRRAIKSVACAAIENMVSEQFGGQTGLVFFAHARVTGWSLHLP